MTALPKRIVDAFEVLKKDSPSRIVLKVIRNRYYVYKERGIWVREKHNSKTLSEYIGRITEDGLFIKKTFAAKNDLESAKALIAENGGEIIWSKREERKETANALNLNANTVDLSILMSLSMNARMPVPRIAKLAGINEQTAYSRIRVLEKRFGINYILEADTELLGFTTYLILVKFEAGMPPTDELRRAFENAPKIQFAAITKGDYDVVAYMLDENSVKAEDDLWKIMSETTLSKYDAKWHMVPFGQAYSFMPLREEFIEKVLSQRQWHRRRFVVITPTQEDILKREFLLLKELNANANMDFSEIDKKYGLGRGASRYTYHQLIDEGVIIRPTINLANLPLRYIGMLRTETVNPGEVSKNRYRLLMEELEYGTIANKYALIGNTSMPESLTFFIPIVIGNELEDASAPLALVKGTVTRSLIISQILTGSLCYRRFDNMHAKQYSTLLALKKVEQKKIIEYE